VRELAGLCADNGLRIAIYPHVGMWVHRIEDALRLVKKVDRKNVGVSFNLCHALLDARRTASGAARRSRALSLPGDAQRAPTSHPAKVAMPTPSRRSTRAAMT